MDGSSAGESGQSGPECAGPHGFELSAEEHTLLRDIPPLPAVQWAAAAFGYGAKVESLRALLGGTSSAVHELIVRDQGGRVQHAVLRRYVRAGWLAREPGLAAREARTLEFLRDTALPAPRLLAVDPDGSAAGVPAVLMERLPGAIEWSPNDLSAFLRGLVDLLIDVHAVPPPNVDTFPLYAPYELEMLRPPVWASTPHVWMRAIDTHLGPAPAYERVFLHRDFHPGNVLWARGQVSGIIDWVNACSGVPEADVGHCRLNLTQRFGLPAADHFLKLYQERSGRTAYHPYWDIVAALGGLDEAWDAAPDPIVERFLSAAVAQL